MQVQIADCRCPNEPDSGFGRCSFGKRREWEGELVNGGEIVEGEIVLVSLSMTKGLDDARVV
jgi:hypothetical protein